jgi:hypothetical protein
VLLSLQAIERIGYRIPDFSSLKIEALRHFRVVVSTLFRNLYKGDVNLCTMYTTTLSDEEMIKIKVVDIEKLHNFVVDNFSSEDIFSGKTMFEFPEFKIWILKMNSNGETTKIKVVDLKKLHNFGVDNLLI